MKRFAVLFASTLFVLSLASSAMAAPITGIFTMIDSTNSVLTNTPGRLQHTPFTGSISSSTSSSTLPPGPVGTMTIDPFVFFGVTAYAHGPAGVGTPIDVTKVDATHYTAHMLFNWGSSTDIDVIVLWKKGFGDGPSDWQPGGAYPATGATDTTDWQFAMLDDNGDSISGHSMWNGPFGGFNANFDFNKVVPEPASLLLIGTGLVGLLGIARRKK